MISLIKTYVPSLDALHFSSDGPVTQYKNKSNFYLFKYYCNALGLKKASWNFTTPGHGKSHADGVGGTVKGLCDRAVGQGRDVMNVNDIVQVVQDAKSKITMFIIVEDDIKHNGTLLPKEIKALPQSNKVFQVIWNRNKPETLFLNSLSCTSGFSSPPCQHYALRPNHYTFPSFDIMPENPLESVSPLRENLQNPDNFSKDD